MIGERCSPWSAAFLQPRDEGVSRIGHQQCSHDRGGPGTQFPGARTPSTFTVASVPGTPWRMVLMVPDSKLFATISGTTQAITWLVFAVAFTTQSAPAAEPSAVLPIWPGPAPGGSTDVGEETSAILRRADRTSKSG